MLKVFIGFWLNFIYICTFPLPVLVGLDSVLLLHQANWFQLSIVVVRSLILLMRFNEVKKRYSKF